MTYPIVEIFNSIQGEGFWTGTQMAFVRLAGCNVGKLPMNLYDPVDFIASALGLTVCCSVLGERFVCDTQYRKATEQLTPEEIAHRVKGMPIVCITGGEPLLHNIQPLVDFLVEHKHRVHLETSGTRSGGPLPGVAWITCSPKQDCAPAALLPCVDEWKFVIGGSTKLDDTAASIQQLTQRAGFPALVYLQPINDVDKVDPESLAVVLDLLRRNPTWRLSLQLHKIIHVR